MINTGKQSTQDKSTINSLLTSDITTNNILYKYSSFFNSFTKMKQSVSPYLKQMKQNVSKSGTNKKANHSILKANSTFPCYNTQFNDKRPKSWNQQSGTSCHNKTKMCENKRKSKFLLSNNIHYVNLFDGVSTFSQFSPKSFSHSKTNFSPKSSSGVAI